MKNIIIVLLLFVWIMCDISLKGIGHDVIEWSQAGYEDVEIIYRIWNNTEDYVDTVKVFFDIYCADTTTISAIDYITDVPSGEIRVDTVVFSTDNKKVIDIKIDKAEIH
jgi:hypothetical protein